MAALGGGCVRGFAHEQASATPKGATTVVAMTKAISVIRRETMVFPAPALVDIGPKRRYIHAPSHRCTPILRVENLNEER